jgi:hypothetical protein
LPAGPSVVEWPVARSSAAGWLAEYVRHVRRLLGPVILRAPRGEAGSAEERSSLQPMVRSWGRHVQRPRGRRIPPVRVTPLPPFPGSAQHGQQRQSRRPTPRVARRGPLGWASGEASLSRSTHERHGWIAVVFTKGRPNNSVAPGLSRLPWLSRQSRGHRAAIASQCRGTIEWCRASPTKPNRRVRACAARSRRGGRTWSLA